MLGVLDRVKAMGFYMTAKTSVLFLFWVFCSLPLKYGSYKCLGP